MDKSRWIIDGDVAYRDTPKGRVLIDAIDIDLVCSTPGPLEIKNGYCRIGNDRNSIHRVILNPDKGMFIDHINHNPLDNRRSNLRICTRSENARNRKANSIGKSYSLFKGVTFHKHASSAAKPWRAFTTVLGKRVWLGYFWTEIEAAKAYNEYARKTFGEFAMLNAV